MPDFIAIKCFQCDTFQVQQVKKSSNKWACKVCNSKQSVRKVYATSSSAKDVRGVVQRLNATRIPGNSSGQLCPAGGNALVRATRDGDVDHGGFDATDQYDEDAGWEYGTRPAGRGVGAGAHAAGGSYGLAAGAGGPCRAAGRLNNDGDGYDDYDNPSDALAQPAWIEGDGALHAQRRDWSGAGGGAVHGMGTASDGDRHHGGSYDDRAIKGQVTPGQDLKRANRPTWDDYLDAPDAADEECYGGPQGDWGEGEESVMWQQRRDDDPQGYKGDADVQAGRRYVTCLPDKVPRGKGRGRKDQGQQRWEANSRQYSGPRAAGDDGMTDDDSIMRDDPRAGYRGVSSLIHLSQKRSRRDVTREERGSSPGCEMWRAPGQATGQVRGGAQPPPGDASNGSGSDGMGDRPDSAHHGETDQGPGWAGGYFALEADGQGQGFRDAVTDPQGPPCNGVALRQIVPKQGITQGASAPGAGKGRLALCGGASKWGAFLEPEEDYEGEENKENGVYGGVTEWAQYPVETEVDDWL